MSKTNWSKTILAIMNAKPPRGKDAYTYAMIESKTGINTSTLSRLATGDYTRLDYDKGVKLMALYSYLKETNKL